MRRTPTLQAAAAALGLVAGFAMTPASASSPLAGEVTPHAVAVAWRVSAPPEMPVAGVQADDWGGRLPPEPAAKPSPERERAPARPREGRPAPKPRTSPRAQAEPRPAPGRPVVLRGAELAAATFGVRREVECPREAARREAEAVRREAARVERERGRAAARRVIHTAHRAVHVPRG